MPKSIVREFDESTTGSVLSTNFSVLVPGYMVSAKETNLELIDKAKKAGIYFEDSGIYKLSSRAQFEEYIGKFGGGSKAVKAPTLHEYNPAMKNVDISCWCDHISIAEFSKASGYTYYEGTQLHEGDPGYGENGYLLSKFVFNVGTAEERTETYRFTPKTIDDLYRNLPTPEEAEAEHITMDKTFKVYFKIKNGEEGNDEFLFGDHMGNQIAYELLGLGYTVYFKKLNKEESATNQLRTATFWEPLKNKSTYRIRYLTTGGCYDVVAQNAMADIAAFNNKVTIEEADTFGNVTGRGDVIALMDIDEGSFGPIENKEDLLHAFGNGAGMLATNPDAAKYCGIFGPRVVYNMPEDEVYGSDVKFPGSFHYLACAATAQQRYAEWYAVAGYTRGISSKSIAYTTYNFGDIDINTLAPRTLNTFTTKSINLILNERGNYYLWGNRTAAPLDNKGLVFSHFLNIRQLCTTIKQVLFDATRQFTFEPNSDLLWINFVNAIKPTLENMKADQGINGYKISRVATNKKALLVARIRIVPIEALEDFDISIYLQDSLSGIIVDADEEVAE